MTRCVHCALTKCTGVSVALVDPTLQQLLILTHAHQHVFVCVALQPHYSSEEQKIHVLLTISEAHLSHTIQGVWEQRRYQPPHSKIPSAKESALFETRDVVWVRYGIASSPHKITLKRNTDKLH